MSLPLPHIPSYDIQLPVSKLKIAYRPFLVKEEKILLLAGEDNNTSDIISAIKQVLTNCTYNKVDISKLPAADVEYLFIKIRSQSIGTIIRGEVTCSVCSEKSDYNIDLDKVEIVNNVKDTNIKFDESTIITMKYPTIITATDIAAYDDIDKMLATVAWCIDIITIEDSVYKVGSDITISEVVEWLHNLTKENADKLGKFLEDLPKLVYVDETKCKFCEAPIPVYMEGLENFFV